MNVKIGVIQFPGSNTERETMMACRRAKMEPVEFLWNHPTDAFSSLDGYIIVGGFSYEDRSRSGVIASLDPIIKKIKDQANLGKPVLGICNGAQILIESGIVPGAHNDSLSIALTKNKQIQNDKVVGVGYYNCWANLLLSVSPELCAFTCDMDKSEAIKIPLAHGEGRFIMNDKLLEKLISNGQTVFRYCNERSEIKTEFPTNPNGSVYNLAAISNASGNVMAIMPHPERTINGDKIFSSMKKHIITKTKKREIGLNYKPEKYIIKSYNSSKNSTVWTVEMIITDNEADTVQTTLSEMGISASVKRQTWWEIETAGNNTASVLEKISKSGELYNSNKEFLSKPKMDNTSCSFLVRDREDVLGRSKLEILKTRFMINNLDQIKHGVVWSFVVPEKKTDQTINKILNTNIIYNPNSHECYRIH